MGQDDIGNVAGCRGCRAAKVACAEDAVPLRARMALDGFMSGAPAAGCGRLCPSTLAASWAG